jgi:hypothetical protein
MAGYGVRRKSMSGMPVYVKRKEKLLRTDSMRAR